MKARLLLHDLPKAARQPVLRQSSALCFRIKRGRPKILLVTTRKSRRWIIPKGWPVPGQSPAEAAATEAFEEAGVTGKVSEIPLGMYSYTKTEVPNQGDLPCMVALFPLKVKKKHATFPERTERRRKWMSPKKAAKLVDEPELRKIIKSFAPD